ncbi:MAG: C25 family cysteine peptidase [Hyphomicrobiales bacterium]
MNFFNFKISRWVLALIFMVTTTQLLADNLNEGWNIVDNNKTTNEFQLKNSTRSSIQIQFDLGAFYASQITTPYGEAMSLSTDDAGTILEKGSPELPLLATSINVPNDVMDVTIVDSKYIEYENVLIAPSKGSITRDIDPASIPYTFGRVYQEDNFYPGKVAELSNPYLIRNLRGQAVNIYPFQYNPVTKILRVYTEITLSVNSTGVAAKENVSKPNSENLTSPFQTIAESHFINYTKSRYTPLDDTPGKMLIISHNDFLDVMEDFVDWKNQKGISTEIVDVATIGNAAAIKTYVENYYTNNPELTYLLIIGDNAQVPASSTTAGPSDHNYGYLSGNDHRADIFVGRFSGTNDAEIQTQVDRTLYYEKDVTTSENFMAKALGSASNQGGPSSGDDGESDAQHMDNIGTDLAGYGYTVTKVYQTGGSVTAMSNAINAGTGFINYVGHGSNTSWVNVPFSTTHINQLTNVNELPFIMDVACVNGNFTNVGSCFAEAFMRATYNNQPTGAIGIAASTINQYWAQPMRAQDEMTDILIESYANNIKRTFGGLVINGIFDMIDVYGTNGEKMADTWEIFGDPSLVVRTKVATTMAVTNPGTIDVAATSIAIPVDANGALVAISNDGTLLGAGVVENGTATVNISNLPASGNVTLTVTAYNKVTYTGTIAISSTPQAPSAQFAADITTVEENATVTFTDQSIFAPTSWAWEFEGGTPATSTDQNPTVTYANAGTYKVKLTATNSYGSDIEEKVDYITVYEVVAPVADFNASVTTISAGGTVTFSDASQNLPTSWAWEFEGGTPATSTDQNPEVTYASSGTYKVKLTATNSAGSDVKEVNGYINVTINYCTVSGNSQTYEWIAGVKVGSFNNTSAKDGYGDFTSKMINVTAGNNAVTLTPGYSGSTYKEYWKIWIDYNKDGDFTDAGEEVLDLSGTGALTGNINIPATATGQTRLRVSMSYSANPPYCGTFTYGEAEDYTVVFPRLRGVNVNSDINVYPNPATNVIFVKSNTEIQKLNIMDINGTVRTLTNVGTSQSINTENFPAGVYFIQVTTEGGVSTYKIVKN